MPVGEANLFGLHQFDNQTSFFSQSVFPQGVGYALLIGYGAIFAFITILVYYLDHKYAGVVYHSEEFNTAGRSIKTGLIAVDVVSHWTWVATLLQSTSEAYWFGISGPLWFANTATVPLVLFGTVALQIKRKAPKAHTVIELVRRRWGHTAALVFMYICFLNNILVCVLVFIGAADVFTAATGMNVYSALMLIPLFVVIYTVVGGLKATFVSSYLHTVVIFVVLNVLVYAVFASSKHPVGSIAQVWRNLTRYATVEPVKGNKDGSFLTVYSMPGIKFAVFNLIGACANLAADQAYWQSAIAAEPRAAFKGYILGGLLWLPIPFTLATALGLGALALDLPISSEEAEAGLVALAVAQFLMGKVGVVLVLTMIFMAATSTGSAELIAMSSIYTYDIHKAYINKKASGRELLIVSRVSVGLLGILMGALSCLLVKLGINVNFLFLALGLLVASGFPPLTFLLVWPAVPKGAAIAGALIGQVVAVVAWVVHTKIVYDTVTIDTLQQFGPILDGTVVAIMLSAVVCVLWTWVSPDTTGGFSRFQDIEVMDDVTILDPADKDTEAMDRSVKWTVGIGVVLSVLLSVVWPLLILPAGVFSESYFWFFVVMSMAWAAIAAVICTFMPLLEARKILAKVVKLMLGFEIEANASRSASELEADVSQI